MRANNTGNAGDFPSSMTAQAQASGVGRPNPAQIQQMQAMQLQQQQQQQQQQGPMRGMGGMNMNMGMGMDLSGMGPGGGGAPGQQMNPMGSVGGGGGGGGVGGMGTMNRPGGPGGGPGGGGGPTPNPNQIAMQQAFQILNTPSHPVMRYIAQNMQGFETMPVQMQLQRVVMTKVGFRFSVVLSLLFFSFFLFCFWFF